MRVPCNGKEVHDQMVVVQNHIKAGARTFLKEEYSKLAIFCAFFGVILAVAVDQPWKANEAGDKIAFPMTTMAFLVGAATSMLCGYIGMTVATDANAKVTSETTTSIGAGFDVAFAGGQVLGFCLVGIALLLLQLMIMIYKPIVLNSDEPA